MVIGNSNPLLGLFFMNNSPEGTGKLHLRISKINHVDITVENSGDYFKNVFVTTASLLPALSH